MKHLGLMPVLLLLGIGILAGPVTAELTASQQVPSPVNVGDTVMVTVMLTYNGANSTQAIVTPMLPFGLASDMPGDQSADLYPMNTVPISYPIRAEQSGSYVVISQIAYAEDGTWRSLRLEAPLTALGESTPPAPPFPGEGPIGPEMPPDAPGGSFPVEPGPGISEPGGQPGGEGQSEIIPQGGDAPPGEGHSSSE